MWERSCERSWMIVPEPSWRRPVQVTHCTTDVSDLRADDPQAHATRRIGRKPYTLYRTRPLQ
jgi:hypothetical protein